MKNFSLIFLIVSSFSCHKSFLHERWIANESSDTITVMNPDFEDTIYVIAPSQKNMIYSYEILDHKQESEKCGWMGDTLYIINSKDSVCEKGVSLEYNWSSSVTGDKERKQVCTFTVHNDNF